ncbi:transglutaminase family protein [Agromyces mariniharenae]|uniref:Transglutaminase family protein n=1 Tax=Agromyces mariniharenae TaxID=2604423 RepID=A0A5S4V2Y6_9MICO|nr:transglutaminase family protein [Agromyces mariniharenae]TYL53346.1 transglutaminase family protein [Agromyces mariniharenae]
MSRIRIVHRTGFTYEEPATASYNEARMLPHSGGEQFVLQAGLDIRPGATQHSYLDYWGTRVSTFEVLTPHRELSVTATSLVEVRPSPVPRSELSWDELEVAAGSTVGLVEASSFSDATAPPPEVVELARDIRAEGAPVGETALEISRAVGGAMEYMRGVTGVHSTGAEAWAERKGVCQDIAHVALGALRSVGIPARYVSGYLHPDPDADLGQTVVGESHAWVEWFAGEWRGYDPTNLKEVGELHVLVGRGRDYSDVTPLRGVYAGPGASELFVSVEVTRVA